MRRNDEGSSPSPHTLFKDTKTWCQLKSGCPAQMIHFGLFRLRAASQKLEGCQMNLIVEARTLQKNKSRRLTVRLT
jgi:hypothetical protein